MLHKGEVMNIMKPGHPRWFEFLERLEGPEGCNFGQGVPGNSKSNTWRCAGGRDKPIATNIIETMGDIDIQGSLAFFEKRGGFCDCQILLNVPYGR